MLKEILGFGRPQKRLSPPNPQPLVPVDQQLFDELTLTKQELEDNKAELLRAREALNKEIAQHDTALIAVEAALSAFTADAELETALNEGWSPEPDPAVDAAPSLTYDYAADAKA